MSGNGKQPVKRVQLTLQEELKVFDSVSNGKTYAQASEKFNVLQSSITQMMKDKDSTHQALKENKRLRKRKRKMLSYEVKVSIINDMVLSWHVQVEVDAPTLNVICNVLQTKALAFQDQILEDHSATIDPELVESLKKFWHPMDGFRAISSRRGLPASADVGNTHQQILFLLNSL